MALTTTLSFERVALDALITGVRDVLCPDAPELPRMCLGLTVDVLDVGPAADYTVTYLQSTAEEDPDPVWRELDSRDFRAAVAIGHKTASGDHALAQAVADKLARELTRRLACRAVLVEEETCLGIYERGVLRTPKPI
jgi:hypothetical protein